MSRRRDARSAGRTVDTAQTSAALPADQSGDKPRVVFTLNTKLQIAPDTDPSAMLDDAACFMDAATALVNHLATEVNDEGSEVAANPGMTSAMLFGALHLLKLANGLSDAANSSLIRARQVRP